MEILTAKGLTMEILTAKDLAMEAWRVEAEGGTSGCWMVKIWFLQWVKLHSCDLEVEKQPNGKRLWCVESFNRVFYHFNLVFLAMTGL